MADVACGSLDTPGVELNTAPEKSGASGLGVAPGQAGNRHLIVEVLAIVP
jgi:hypothetical protein